jgi:hypothetical protein
VEGRLTVDLRSTVAYARVRHLQACPDIGPACDEEPAPTPYRHDVRTVVSELPLEVSYGVLSWLAVEARVPLRLVGVWPQYTTLDGVALPSAIDDHHRRETLVGPADPWLSVRAAARARGWIAGARLGVSLPLGRTEPDPYALGRQGLPHQHIQFGSGTVMPVLSGFVQRAWSRVEVAASAFAVLNATDNRHGYRAPTRALLSLRTTFPLVQGRVRPFVAVDLSTEASERWFGRVGDEGPTDRADVLAGGGVAWQVSPKLTLDAAFRLRAAKLTHGSSLDYPGFVQLGGSFAYDTSSSEKVDDEASSNW